MAIKLLNENESPEIGLPINDAKEIVFETSDALEEAIGLLEEAKSFEKMHRLKWLQKLFRFKSDQMLLIMPNPSVG